MKQELLNTTSVSRKMHLFRATLYCNLWPVRLYYIFPHHLTIFGKEKSLNIKCVLIFSATSV